MAAPDATLTRAGASTVAAGPSSTSTSTSTPTPTSGAAPDERCRGLAYAFAAYLAWGGIAVYIKALAPVPPLEILAHRVVWSVVFLAGLLAARRRLGLVARARAVPWLLASSTLLIAANWLLFIWSVGAGRLLEASLGYYVNPLVNVLLGVLFLGERLTRRQLPAVALAAAGVAVLVLRLGSVPWLALALALSFGLYGLVRKRAGLDAAAGLLAETALLAPPALAWLALRAADGSGAFGRSAAQSLLLAGAGVITAVPLVWFALGVQRLRLSTMGLVQYVAPTAQFLLAVLLYGEPFTGAHAAAFACIWAGLAVFSWDALRPRPPAVAGPRA